MIPYIPATRAQTSHAALRPTAPVGRCTSRGLSLVCTEGEVYRDLERAKKEIEILKSELALASLWKRQQPQPQPQPQETDQEAPALTQFIAHLPSSTTASKGSKPRLRRKRVKEVKVVEEENTAAAVKELREKNLELSTQLKQLNQKFSALLKEKEDICKQNVQLKNENENLQEQLSKIQVYSRDSTLYRALRASELKVEKLEREIHELKTTTTMSHQKQILGFSTLNKEDQDAVDLLPLVSSKSSFLLL